MKLATRFSRHSRQVIGSGEPISLDTLRERVPCIFAASAHDSRSAGYTYIPTSAVVEQLGAKDWLPTFAVQAMPRKEDRFGHAKHMLRFRHASADQGAAEVPEIVLINSHDGTTSYQLLGGFFRFICCNGLILGDGSLEVRVPHRGNIIEGVVSGAGALLEHFGQAGAAVERMKALHLSRDEQIALASAALPLRWEAPGRVDPVAVLKARRAGDEASDLWSTFNRLQENLVRGGVSVRDAQRPSRRRQARGVDGITANVRLNRSLWSLAEQMAALKSA